MDIITLGTGVDTLTVGATGDGGDADLVKFTATNQLVTNSAIITDWDTAMEIDFDISATLDSGANLILLDDGADASAAGAIWNDITGSTDMGALTANSHGIILSTTTAYTSTDQVETALEYGGGFQLMTGGALSVGDRFLVAWDDNTNSYIGMATTNTAVPDDGYFGSGSLAVVQLVKLSGIATLAGAVIATSDVDLS